MLNQRAREVIAGGALAHLVTLEEDGSPQVSVVWAGLDGDEVVTGHLSAGQRKLRNLRRDPRVALSFEAPTSSWGLRHYLVLHGSARVTEGGAPELLRQLAATYLGPGVTFPPMPDPPPGFVLRVTVTRVGGNGPWHDDR